jgi:hypothetical protein
MRLRDDRGTVRRQGKSETVLASVFNHQHVETRKNEGIDDEDCATLFPHVELGYQRKGHTSDAMLERYADFRTE